LGQDYFLQPRKVIMGKFLQAVIAVCVVSASLSQPAFANSTVTLTQEDPQGYFWDSRGSQSGQAALQIYQATVPNLASQAFTWTPAGSGFTICSLKICLSDNGTGKVLMSSKADVFTITSQAAVLDITTGRYIGQPAVLGNGGAMSIGTTPVAWTFALAGTVSGNVASSAHINIMPLGDSITEGYATWPTFVQGGYRCPLDYLLQNKGLSFSFVGDSASLEPGVVTACSQVNWEGHGGYDIGSVKGVAVGHGSIRASQPQIVLLLAGTNDIAQGELGNITGQMTNMLNYIFAADPNAWVIVSTLPPMNGRAPAAISNVAGWATQVPAANAQIRAVASRYSRVSLVDFYSAAAGNIGANIGTDGIHPSVTGYGLLADLWYGAILAHLNIH
jgi:GDSL-like Lipase/Acylhydrolase family